ncbi:hypothetical protein DCS_01488 [Drechmeria coniospora]|uniref:Uncharacterized protein n=1 Tax=Drechmeria coniospora TaxID=98403 RepID=A0A151GTF6_DRECN|nr:hypothetical protein DCS_01488 [Drechmeria coniospora]KYK60351.1 hypothetical protein DCS_01488 [Drechmeria coniospora]
MSVGSRCRANEARPRGRGALEQGRSQRATSVRTASSTAAGNACMDKRVACGPTDCSVDRVVGSRAPWRPSQSPPLATSREGVAEGLNGREPAKKMGWYWYVLFSD